MSKLADRLQYHSLSDQGLLAIATDEKAILLERDAGTWKQVDILKGHEQLISALDWGTSPTGGSRLVSSSHDRNSYVWMQKLDPVKGVVCWSPELVITRLNRAGLCVKWSSSGRKFAIGSGESAVCVCVYDEERELWAPRLIRKGHTSSIMGLAWHPSDAVLATVSTDNTCRLTNASIKGVDQNPLPNLVGSSRFGDTLLELETPGGWGLSVSWSPSGCTLAIASQKGLSVIGGFGDLENAGNNGIQMHPDGPLVRQDLTLPSLPLKTVVFLSDDVLIGGGFDYKPLVVRRQSSGSWAIDGFIEAPVAGNQCVANCIVSISGVRSENGKLRCMTSSIDGKIAEWEVE